MLAHKRGILDRLGSTFGGAPASDKAIFRLAERKMAAAARLSTIRATAEANTRAMLTQLITGLGFANVTVTFADPLATATVSTVPTGARDN